MASKTSMKEARPANTRAKRITMSTDDAEAYPHYAQLMRICSNLERPKPEGISDPRSISFHNRLMLCESLVLTINQKVTGWLATLDYPSEDKVKKSLASQAARKEAACKKEAALKKGPAPTVPAVPAVLAAGGRTYASVASIKSPVPVRTLNIRLMSDVELSGA